MVGIKMNDKCPKCGKRDEWARIPDFKSMKEYWVCSCKFQKEIKKEVKQ